MTKRILVLAASVGAGHVRAAQAVELALRENHPDFHIRNVDVLELTNTAFRRLYGKAYIDLVNRAPHVLGYFYDLLDKAPATGKQRSDRLRLSLEKLNLRKFIRFLHDEPWDVIINTHFLPAEIIASLRQQQKLDVKQVTVTTDFDTHRLWVNQPCDHYFTATEEGARYLSYWGVPADHITPAGIPIHPDFSRPKERAALLEKHGLAADRPILMQLAGGFGVGPIEKIYRAILETELPLQAVVVTGRNEDMRSQLEKVEVPSRHRAKVLGFTNEIDEFMQLADLVVSKPGGLTTSETLASGAGMVIVNPVPGQESRNSDFLLENGAAIKANNMATLPYKLTALLRDTSRLNRLKNNARSLGKPRAAFEIAAKSLELVS